MEYTLYFDFRKVTVSDDDPCCTCDASALLLFNPDDKSFETAYNLFLNEKSYSSLYIKTDIPDYYTRLLQKNFTLINAAGGVIENENGEILMIFRNGKWDLPKGKQEEGEAIGICLAKEMIAATYDFVDGYYFSFPFNRVHMLPAILFGLGEELCQETN